MILHKTGARRMSWKWSFQEKRLWTEARRGEHALCAQGKEWFTRAEGKQDRSWRCNKCQKRK